MVISENQFEKLMQKVKDGERFIKCDSCKKWFTQTFHKGKKSLPICPWCGRHNTQFNENQEVDERSRSLAFTRKKRLFSKSEMMANPDRYKDYDKEIKEIGTYKFSEIPKHKGAPRDEPDEYTILKKEHPFIKEMGDFEYLYDVKEEEHTPVVTIYVLDKVNKVKAGVAEFELRGIEDFFVALPYVKKEYRNKGIALEIYKIILTFGNLISGKSQSHEAVGLWKKMYRVLPNKMTFIDDNAKEHEIKNENDKLIIADTGEDVHAGMGGYLKLHKS